MQGTNKRGKNRPTPVTLLPLKLMLVSVIKRSSVTSRIHCSRELQPALTFLRDTNREATTSSSSLRAVRHISITKPVGIADIFFLITGQKSISLSALVLQRSLEHFELTAIPITTSLYIMSVASPSPSEQGAGKGEIAYRFCQEWSVTHEFPITTSDFAQLESSVSTRGQTAQSSPLHLQILLVRPRTRISLHISPNPE